MVANVDPLNVAFTAETIKRRSLLGAAATFVAQGLKFVMQFASQVALARLLDPAAFGLVAMVAPVLGLVQVLNDLGFGQAVVQRSDITHRQISALFWVSLLIGGGLTLVAMVLAPLAAWFYGEPEVMPIMLALASLIFLSSLSVLPTALLNRQMRFVPLAVIDTCNVLAGLVIGVTAAWLGAGYWSLVLMQTGSSLSTVLLAWFFTSWRPSRPARDPSIRSLINFGANLMGANLATYFSMTADNMLVGAVRGEVALGLYDRAYTLVIKPLSQLMAPVSRVAVPMLARLQDSPDRYRSAYLQMVQLVQMACVPGMIFCVILAGPAILFLLGPKWVETVPVFAWICVGGVTSALFASMSWLFTTQDRTRELMIYSTWCSLLNIASFAIGIIWGVVGVARLSALCFVFVQTPLISWAATRRGPIATGMLVRALLPQLAAMVVDAGVLWLLAEHVQPSGFVGLVLTALASYAVFLAVIFCLPGGRERFRSIANLRSVLRRTG